MKLTKRQLKRIIKEEYSKLKKEGLLSELFTPESRPGAYDDPSAEILDLASRPEGVDLEEVNHLFGNKGFDAIDSMEEDGIVWLDDQEGIVYASGSQPSAGLESAVDKYVDDRNKNNIREASYKQHKRIIR